MGDPGFIGLIAIVAVVGLTFTLAFVRRLLEMSHERQMRTPPPTESLESLESLSKRLDRIENAVDATSLEVERIAEASRFMAKLLAERGANAPAPPSIGKVPEKVITPH
jgi:hypothetical protein